jgi:hypothetical protein
MPGWHSAGQQNAFNRPDAPVQLGIPTLDEIAASAN